MNRMFSCIERSISMVRKIHSNHSLIELMTSQEVATALRPFFFVVHPDRFWKYPKEKDTNEDSLKQLNAFIENLIERKQTNDTKITFYLRDEKDINRKSDDFVSQNVKQTEESYKSLKQIDINLLKRENVNKTVHRILSQCKLSTEYLERIGKQPKMSSNENKSFNKNEFNNNSSFSSNQQNLDQFWFRNQFKQKEIDLEDIEDIIDNKRKSDKDLIEWLRENDEKINSRLKASQPIREELLRLKNQLKDELNLNELVFGTDWGVSHIRGCLKSLNTLKQQYSRDLQVLNGKTLVFGRQTGVSFDGHVILNIEDVRHNWLELIRNIHKYDSLLEKLPFIEGLLSGCLCGIEIGHRKFRPEVMVERYIKQLKKLTTALVEYKREKGFSKSWPQMLDKYELVVECESGPLMLSPTGQFIVPASCPAFLLIDFISENMQKSKHLREIYLINKSKEVDLINKCLTSLGLCCIEKDDNVTPDLMIKCCQHLLDSSHFTSRFLRSSRLRVSHYYSVLLDGEICIPWNFTV